MNDRSFMRNVLVWAIPFAVVLVALGYETRWGLGIDQGEALPRPGAPAPVPVALLPEYTISGGVDARRETVERALFNPTRRPAPPATQTAAAAGSAQHGQYALTGTTVMGNVATAFLREVKSGKSHTVRQGEALNGVTVAEVAPDHVTLKQGSDVEELSLKIASGPRSTVQVAAPTPPGAAAHPGVPPQGAVPQAAGGSGVNGNVANATRPVAPAPNPPQQAAGAQPNGSISVSELLAQRRRAARAAAEAAAAGQAATRP